MPKAYLAARFSRASEMVRKAAELDVNGVEVNARWIGGSHEYFPHPNESEAEFNRRCAMDDVNDIEDADMFICFTEEPNEDFTYSRGGRHVELGFAIASGKEIHVIGPRENVFYFMPEITQWDTWKDFIDNYIYPEYGQGAIADLMKVDF